ncbi:CBS domain-containing protein [Maribacter sp. HTCC2170]|uniref:CBS domain-containing protein n=1 Tax=Maribacter sp. (strain HTCC2170 / KCCM 42371) TaxID=313603 RepID=UPI00006BD295|nr:CBS domain-containing protein [Maribacter sp. HTCC2170]EAR02838.1 CBS domain pair protein [Maribacter sp. HTCC2170]
MGELNVEKLIGNPNKSIYIKQLMSDIKALEYMLENNMFEKDITRIGAEQEFCLVNKEWGPANNAVEILKELDQKYFTSEIALYNLEINLDPHELKGDCFSTLHRQLKKLLNTAEEAAAKKETKIMLTGILPTIRTKHLSLSYMTPLKRYKILNEAIKEVRKNDIELHIKGVDELNLKHDSILYEGCNTSFQSHLQINPDEFADTYNWAQAIAGPILSICTNSPMLMGRELWEESRIALFAQSVDTRASTFVLNEREPRVGFGNRWAQGSVADFFKDTVIGFRSLITTDFETDSMTEIQEGKTPKLKALKLHNGTVYKWNRLCYGTTDGKAHMRIENRYIPSGPSTADEIANMMFWVGVMKGRPKEFDDIHTKMEFKDAKSNFFNAARYGMATQFYWNGKLVSSQDLLMDHFLPMAYRGLYSMKVSPADAEQYLRIIKNRIRSRNGSRWIVEGFRKLKKEYKTPDALKILSATMYERQDKGYNVDIWQLPRGDEFKVPKDNRKVGERMNIRTITAQENDSMELVLRMMQWKNIHHVPILDIHLDLVGLLTWTDVGKYLDRPEEHEQSINQIMQKNLITVTPETPLDEATRLMEENEINCLPVVRDKKLVGIITSKDL